MMEKTKTTRVADSKPESGSRTVVISLTEYNRLLRRIEDLEDALALDEARKNATGFADYSEIRRKLKKSGSL